MSLRGRPSGRHAGDYSPGTLRRNLHSPSRWSSYAKVLLAVADRVIGPCANAAPVTGVEAVTGAASGSPRTPGGGSYLMSWTPRATGTFETGRTVVTGPVKNGLRQTPSTSLPPVHSVSWKPV